MKKIPYFSVLFLVGFALVHVGTIRKNDDPIVKTQSDSILFQEKMEQEKDGKKEAPMPSFKLYGGNNGFLSEAPVDHKKEEEKAEAAPGTSGTPEAKETAPAADDWWVEDTAGQNTVKESDEIDVTKK